MIQSRNHFPTGSGYPLLVPLKMLPYRSVFHVGNDGSLFYFRVYTVFHSEM